MRARGAFSTRQFDPALAGGPLRDLSADRILITDRGIAVVERHTARFGPDAANDYMIGRLSADASDEDASTADRDQRIAALEAALAAAQAELASRDLLIQTLRVQIARLRRMQFGSSSEKLAHQLAQLELALEELEIEAAAVDARKPVAVGPQRPAPVRSLPAHLPRGGGARAR